MKLSFIIPYYNGKEYIIECINSLCEQDLPKEEYEIIVVDDCSPDKESLEILENWQQKVSNLRVIHNKKNSRCGVSRNNGVKVAKGEYIWFVDQDDYIVPHCLKTLLEKCQENSLDMLTFDYYDAFPDKCLAHNVVKSETQIMSGIEYTQNILNYDFWHSEYDTNVWHTIFRREFMAQKEVFSPAVSYCEDMIVAQKAIVLAERIMTIPRAYYYYRYNEESVYHTQVGVQGRPLFDSSIWTGSELVNIADLAQAPKAKDIIRQGGIHRINSFTKSVLKYKSDQRKIFYEQADKHTDIVNSAMPYMTKTNKFLISHPKLIAACPKFLYILIKLHLL